MSKIKQPEISIYARVNLAGQLRDSRPYTYGFIFGTVEQICKQYGIKYEQHENCIEFKAPRMRLQMFVEKLHFARIRFSEKLF